MKSQHLLRQHDYLQCVALIFLRQLQIPIRCIMWCAWVTKLKNSDFERYWQDIVKGIQAMSWYKMANAVMN